MTPKQFRDMADDCLERTADWLEAFDPDDLDFSTADGVITLEFADGTRFVLNRQSGNNQMWFAAGARAWHYDWNEDKNAWLDDKDGHELFGNIERVVADKFGRAVDSFS